MTIPLPVIAVIFLVAAIVGAVHGASWYSILGIASPGIMATMLMWERRYGKRAES